MSASLVKNPPLC